MLLPALKILAFLIVAVLCARAAHLQKNDAPPLSPRAFAATLASCFRAIRARGRSAPPRAWRAIGWVFVAVVCLALAVARAIDVDALVRSNAADLPEAVYEGRRGIQRVLVLAFAGVGAAALALTAFRLRRAPHLALAFAAALSLIAYTATRWVSLHAVDRVIGRALLGVRINTWIELAALAAIAVAAVTSRPRPRA